MKSIRRSFHASLLLILFLFTLSPLQTFAQSANIPTIEYVAFGDSLAHGYLNENYINEGDTILLGKGYPVFIKEGIEQELGYDVKLTNAGFSGYQTVHVLDQLNNNQSIRDSLVTADVVTVGIGANDLLELLLNIDIDNIDLNNPEDLAMLMRIFNEEVPQRINEVGENLTEIINKIQDINAEAKIYILGYYNALSYLEGLQDILVPKIVELNEELEKVAINNEAIYVPTFDAFVGKYDIYLPYPDIHPNEEGYQVIAEEFLKFIFPYIDTLVDKVKPEITLIGDDPMELEVGDDYVEPGALAEDDVDGDLTDSIEISSEVDTSTAGTYTVTYTVSDAAGNVASITRTVKVVESKQSGDPKPKPTPTPPEKPGAESPKEEVVTKSETAETVSAGKTLKLPKTATNHPLLLLIGSLLVTSSGAIAFLRRTI